MQNAKQEFHFVPNPCEGGHSMDCDDEDDGGGLSPFFQLQAVLWKNWTVKKRHWKMTLLEIIGPLIVLILLVRDKCAHSVSMTGFNMPYLALFIGCPMERL